MGYDFLKTYAPELIAPGLRVTKGVAQLVRRTLGIDLQLSLDVEAAPIPNPAEYDPNEDPFEE